LLKNDFYAENEKTILGKRENHSLWCLCFFNHDMHNF